MIEEAIEQYYVQQDENGMLLFMEVMVTRMQQAGEFVVPYITVDSFMSEEQINKVKLGDTISLDESHNIVYTFHNEKQNKDVYMVALRDDGKLIGYYEKHEYRNAETMKQYDLW